MSSLSSWDYLFDMPGYVDLNFISISSFDDNMAHLVAKSTRRSSKSSVQEIQ